MSEDAATKFADIYKMFAKKKKTEKELQEKLFKSKEEYFIVGAIVKTILEKDFRVTIYEVENFENLFDYADLFKRLHNAGIVSFFGHDLKFVAVTSYPHELDIVDTLEEILGTGAVPVVAYFVGDFLPTGEAAGGSSDIKELSRVLSLALFNKLCYVILFTTNPLILYDNIPLARYGIKIRDVAPKLVKKLHPEKAKFASSVGFSKLVLLDVDSILSHIRNRRLPTPHTIEEIEKDISFKELILPPSLKEFIRVNILNTLKRDITSISSILLLGPSGDGKTTLAYTIANELGVPAYVVRVELIGSKWIGETEKIANQTMMLINDRSPVVAIFRDAELILGERKGGGEEVLIYERVKAIISSWLRSDRRRFFAVFTISNPKILPEYILHDATFGVYKLPILPPLKREERKAMLSLFLRKLSEKHDLTFNPLNESIDEALDAVAEETWAYSPREIMDIANIAVNIALDKGESAISKETIQLARKYKEIDRISRIEIMKDTINACRKVGLPESLLVDIYKFEQEVEKLRAMALSEEAKKRSLARISG